MNQVSGKVLRRETNAGIPGLLVEIYHVDPETKSHDILPRAARRAAVTPVLSPGSAPAVLVEDRLGDERPGDRISSVGDGPAATAATMCSAGRCSTPRPGGRRRQCRAQSGCVWLGGVTRTG
jgi:hypothetical protein